MIDTAIIISGGLGTRLRPLTDNTPKPLLPIKGKPTVQHIIENLKKHGVKQIIHSVGYKAQMIEDYFKAKPLGISIKHIKEDEPLGTGGAIKLASIGLNGPFFLTWGDNLMDINWTELHKTHLKNNSQITMALTPREDVENFGVAKLQGEKIISFIEKPKRELAPSNLINAGAFVIDPVCLKILPEGRSSIEMDCFEKLAPLGKISAYIHQGQWFPTDTLEKYSLACQNFILSINFEEKKMIIADVDDTICDSCQIISSEMAEVVNKLISKGYIFAFISGTKCGDLHGMISCKLFEEHHLLGNTGTIYELVKAGKRKEIYANNLTNSEKKEILDAFQKLIMQFNIKPITSTEDQLQDRDSQITLSALGRNAPFEIKRNYDPAEEKRKWWVEFLKGYLDEERYEIKIGGTTSIDVTRKGMDKELGIKKFAEHLRMPLSNILFIGDKIYPGGNDYPASKIIDCISVKSPKETLEILKKL